ncbi:MAG TPA: CopD family protein [Steroidobacteraceae bacterium]|nr:CopD family protein [Steroidobacteraceae bacterium]
MPDILSGVLRALSFMLQLQAAGAVFFAAAFGPALTISAAGIRKLAQASATIAVCVVAVQYVLEAARMAGDMAGIFDDQLQALAWDSNVGGSFVVRELGLLLIVAGTRRVAAVRGFALLGVLGAVLVAVSFTLMGHTVHHAHRPILAPLLLAHLLIVAFWFGALWPLCLVSQRESRERAARVVRLFSATAFWLVPVILIVGVAMAALLLPDIAALRQPYGRLLVTKVILFAVLMALAALNKWRLGPALQSPDLQAGRAFRGVVISEYVIIAGVLAVTAVMTEFFSPE